MNEMLMLVLVIAVLLIAVAAFWLPRRRRLTLRIEPVPAQRLDTTPERSEIISEVRVRERAAEAAALAAAAQAAEPAAADPAAQPEPEAVAPAVPARTPVLEQADLFADQRVPMPAPGADRPVFAADAGAPVDALARHVEPPALPDMERVLSLHVMARDSIGFSGRELLELLLQFGLRYGDMNIFHRHEHPTGQGEVLFSLAQAVEPGIFNLDTLERQHVQGISLFMGLPGHKRLHAFDVMVDTARRLAKELQADLLDEHAVPASADQLDALREEVVAFERQRLMPS